MKRQLSNPPVHVDHLASGDSFTVRLTALRPRDLAQVGFTGRAFRFRDTQGVAMTDSKWLNRKDSALIATHVATGDEITVALARDGSHDNEARLGFEGDKEKFKVTRGELLV